MSEGTFELHPGDALYPDTVLELSDVPQTLYVRGDPAALSTPAPSPADASALARPRRTDLPWQSWPRKLRSRRG